MNYKLLNYIIAYILVGLTLTCLAALVYFKDRKNKLFRIFSLYNLSIAWWCFFSIPAVLSTDQSIGVIWCRIFITGVIFTPTLVLHCAYLLLGYPPEKRYKLLLRISYLLSYFFLLSNFTPFFIQSAEKKITFLSYTVPGPIFHMHVLHFFIVMIYAEVLYFIRYLKIKDSQRVESKKYLYYFLSAFIATLGGGSNYFPVYRFEVPVLNPFGTYIIIVYGLVVAYTIIRYRLIDIETVFHKTIAWFLTNAALTIPFVALIYFTKFWHMNFSTLGGLAFLGISLLAFLFFVKIFQPKIDHFFQRRKYNLEEISNHFVEDLVHLKGFGQLIKRIEEVIAETVYPQRTDIFIYNEDKKDYLLTNRRDNHKEAIWLKGDNKFLLWLAKNNKIVHKEFIHMDSIYASIREEAKDYFELTGATVVVPLVLNEKVLGIVNLGKKSSLKRYSALDFHFLTTLKNQSAIAISNSLLYENMEGQVRQRTKELVDVQKQLIQAEKLATVGTLAGGVAHEINNPLTAILTNVQMLLSDNSLNGELDRESLELIEEATRRCRAIVQKLMAYARKPLESSDIKEVNLSDVLSNVISFLGYQLEQENVKIVLRIKKEGSYLSTGNRNEFEQVLTNIILNARDAIKRIKKSGSIHISLSKNENRIKIEIKDEGAGIPKETVPKIFDPFFTTKDVGRGLGLGLSICQAIIEKYNGIISVQSEPNKGSVFTIQLPEIKKESRLKSKVKL